MAFSDFQNYYEVAKKCGLHVVREDFVVSDSLVPSVNDFMRKDIAFIYNSFGYQRSEAAARESLIFPIFKEVWKTYDDALTLLSHEPFQFGEQLTGVIDYLVCKRSSQCDVAAESAVSYRWRSNWLGTGACCHGGCSTTQRRSRKDNLRHRH